MAAVTESTIATLFTDENLAKKMKLSVKVLAKVGDSEFVISDPSGYCNMLLETKKTAHLNCVVPKQFIRILNPKIDLNAKRLIVHGGSSIFKTKAIENVVECPNLKDEKGPAENPVPQEIPQEILRAKKLSDVNKLNARKVISLTHLILSL